MLSFPTSLLGLPLCSHPSRQVGHSHLSGPGALEQAEGEGSLQGTPSHDIFRITREEGKEGEGRGREVTHVGYLREWARSRP